MIKRIGILMNLALAAAALLLGYYFMRSNIAADLYRDRLREEVAKHEATRQMFNEVVRKHVVTELVVNEDDSVCVVFVDANNTEKVVPTPFKKGAVVYVDFLVMDGRLFLRRLFDEKTAPVDALVVDPELQTVNWKTDAEPPRGNAPYAQLNKQGRWVVNMTQNGAIELRKADDKGPRQPLVKMPEVRDYSVIEKEVSSKVDDIGPSDVVRTLFGSGEAKK